MVTEPIDTFVLLITYTITPISFGIALLTEKETQEDGGE